MASLLEKLYQLFLELRKLIIQKDAILNGKIDDSIMELSSEKLYRIAKENLGKDLSPTQNELGCVESLETIHKLAFGDYIGGDKALLSTIQLKKALNKRGDFVRIDKYEVGAIILCVTGESKNRSNGHVGIMGKFQIMSNNSDTGLWDTKYTLASWKKYYQGFPLYFYRKIG